MMGALHDTCVSDTPAEAGTPYLRAHLEKQGAVVQPVPLLLDLALVGIWRGHHLQRVAKPAGGCQLRMRTCIQLWVWQSQECTFQTT